MSVAQPLSAALDRECPATSAVNNERRGEPRSDAAGNLWMIDHQGATVFRCACLDMSPHGMRLRVPLGYGVAEGQRYELRSHLPGRTPISVLGVIGSRWGTVARTRVCVDGDCLDVGLVLDTSPAPLRAVGC